MQLRWGRAPGGWGVHLCPPSREKITGVPNETRRWTLLLVKLGFLLLLLLQGKLLEFFFSGLRIIPIGLCVVPLLVV